MFPLPVLPLLSPRVGVVTDDTESRASRRPRRWQEDGPASFVRGPSPREKVTNCDIPRSVIYSNSQLTR